MTFELSMADTLGNVVFCVSGLTAEMVASELRNRSRVVAAVRVIDETTGELATSRFVPKT